MQIRALGYVGLTVTDVDAWRGFATEMLGAHASPWSDGGGGGLALRLDDRVHRFLLRPGQRDGDPFFGLEVEDAEALERAMADLRAGGFVASPATADELAAREVQGMAHVSDPGGYRIELYHGLAAAPEPFAPSRPMTGFRVGDLGIGHAVLLAPDFEASQRFYRDVLGFRLSDYILQPTRRMFLRCNRRHHSIALSERAGHGIAHLLIEVKDLDDVGRAYDLAQARYPDRIYSTLGRHINDHMVSFYLNTPSGFPVEYGWGGQLLDDRTWQPRELPGPSLWGHDRIGAPPEFRSAVNAQRDQVQAKGLRAPVQAVSGAAFDLSLVR